MKKLIVLGSALLMALATGALMYVTWRCWCHIDGAYAPHGFAALIAALSCLGAFFWLLGQLKTHRPYVKPVGYRTRQRLANPDWGGFLDPNAPWRQP